MFHNELTILLCYILLYTIQQKHEFYSVLGLWRLLFPIRAYPMRQSLRVIVRPTCLPVWLYVVCECESPGKIGLLRPQASRRPQRPQPKIWIKYIHSGSKCLALASKCQSSISIHKMALKRASQIWGLAILKPVQWRYLFLHNVFAHKTHLYVTQLFSAWTLWFCTSFAHKNMCNSP